MSGRDQPRAESPWYCPACVTWVGWKLGTCLEGHQRPRLPLRYDDVPTDYSWKVTRRDRLKAKLLSLRDRLGGDR